MAKKSFSAKKSFKSLFSRSEANIQASVEEDDVKKSSTLKFFGRWKKKKRSYTSQDSLEVARPETPSLAVSELQDDEEPQRRKSSLFGTFQRSKKSLLSYSENDLRKPKSISASLSWRKKNKKKDLSQSLFSHSEVPDVKGLITEQDEYHDEEDPTTPPDSSSQSLRQNVLSDGSSANQKAGFMPPDVEILSIPFIDSDSDTYHTPPDSPTSTGPGGQGQVLPEASIVVEINTSYTNKDAHKRNLPSGKNDASCSESQLNSNKLQHDNELAAHSDGDVSTEKILEQIRDSGSFNSKSPVLETIESEMNKKIPPDEMIFSGSSKLIVQGSLFSMKSYESDEALCGLRERQSLFTTSLDLSSVEESLSDRNYEDILMESNPTVYYLTSSTSSEKPGCCLDELVHQSVESEVSLPSKTAKSIWFNMSETSLVPHKDVDTLTEVSSEEGSSQNICNSSACESSAATLEVIPTIIVHSPAHLDISSQLLAQEVDEDQGTFNSEGHGEDQSSQDTRLISVPQAEAQAFARNELAKDRGTTKNEQEALENETREPEEQLENTRDELITAEFKTTVRSSSDKVLQKSLVGEDTSEAEVLKIVQNDSIQTLGTTETDQQMFMEETNEPEDQETVQTRLVQNIESRHIQPCLKSMEVSSQEQNAHKDSQRSEVIEEMIDGFYRRQKTETPTVVQIEPTKNHQQMFRSETRELEDQENVSKFMKNSDVSHKTKASIVQMEPTDELETTKTDQQIIMLDPNNPEDQQNSETGYVLESESQSMQPQMEAIEVSLFEVGQEENDGLLEVQNAGKKQKAATAKLVTTRNGQQMFVEETHEQEDQGNAATIKNSDVLYNTKAPIVPMEPIEELETTKLNQQINMEETHGQDNLQNVQTMKNSDVLHKTKASTVQMEPTEELETTKTDQQIIIVGPNNPDDQENTETGSVQERLIQPQSKTMEVSLLRQSLYYNYFGKSKDGQEENGELIVFQKAGISQNKRTEELVTTIKTPEQEEQVNVQTVKDSDVSHKTKTLIVQMEPTEEVEISNTDLQIIVEETLKPEDQETVQTGLIQNSESKHIQPRPKSLEVSPHEQRSLKDSAEEREERRDVLHQKQKTETIELSKPIEQQMFSAGTHKENAPSRLNLISESELKNMDVSPQERSSHGQDLEITQMVQEEGVPSILQKETREKWSIMKETRKQEDLENSQTASSQGSKSKQIPQLHTVEETSLDKSSSILQRSRSDGFSVVQITETPAFGQKKPTAELGTAQSHQQMFIEETQKSEDQEITGGGVIKNCPSSQIKGFPKESPEQRLRASKVVGLHVEQSMTPASSTGVKEPAAEVCGDTEVLTGQAKQMKPDQPVCQECGAEECSPAPPCWEPPEVSLTGSRLETPTHLDSWIRPASVHQAREEKATVDWTDLQRTGDRCGTSSEDHAEISLVQAWRETFRSAEVTWGEVTVTKVKPDRDDISSYSPSSQATPEDDEEENDTFPDQTFSRSVAAGDRLFHASTALSTLFEESEAEREESATESDPDMNSGVGILSTTLSQPLTTRDGKEDAMVVRKVSLVSSSTNGSTDHREDSVDDNGFTEASSTASTGFQSGWKNLDSHYTLTDSSSPPSSLSSGYGKGVYTSHFNSQGMGGRSFSAESGGSWKTIESEVQLNSESYSGGRSKAELALPVGVREPELKQTGFDSLVDTSLVIQEADDSEIFKATRVEVLPSLTTETNSSALPSDMDNLVDTLKSMDRPVRQRAQRTASNTPFSSLAPIEEDAPISPIPASPVAEPKKALNGLPPDLGLHWSSPKDMRSPLTMMKEQQLAESPNRSLSLPLRASALNSIVMRRGSFNEQSMNEESSLGHVNGLLSPSRLENSFFFQPSENGKTSSIFRAASLPEIGPAHDRMSSPPKTSDALLGSRFERFSFLTSPSSSLSGISETSRISMPPSIQRSPQDSSIFNHKPPLDLYRPLPSDSTLLNSPPMGLQRSSSLDGSFLINDSKSQKPEPEKNLVLKYRAFPDAYLTKEKEHGKLNPRPGKMLIYDKPGLTGEMIEVRGDVVDATPWEFFGTISVRVIRGGWVLYEKPEFKGEKYALDEGDTELTNPFGPMEEEEGDQMNGEAQDHQEGETEPKEQLKKFVIGSIRRAVRDYSVPEISLFPEENAEGKKVTFRDTSDDARIFGFPIKANSIIINAGLWLVFAEPFFQGVPRVLEVGGFSTPAAWGVTQPYVGSVHPLKIGEPKVENLHEPKIVLYEKPYFTGKSREIYTSMKDFLTRLDQQQSLFVFSVGSMKVLGGCWVGYEKEGFRGYQYLLEEGEYHDWRVWGGVNSELRSVRVIQADLSEPLLVLHGISDEENEGGEEPSFEVTEAVPDVELFGFGVNTRSIHVLSGAWVAYSHVDFSGDQFVLEKGFYNHSGDWGSTDNKICSVQPILAAPSDGPSFRNEVLLYSEPNFQGTCWVSDQNQGRLPDKLAVRSCRVVGGSWVLYEEEQFKGSMYVLSEGDYPTMVSMGFSANPRIRSVRAVPIAFSVPSISLFGLECFEGREVTVDMQITNMHEEGFNPHFLSVRVNSGCWVLCEHSNYRGRQFLLEPIEITNWHKFSSLSGIGSLYPVRHKQRLFRIRNKETGHYMSVQGGVEDMKTGRVVVSEQVDGMSDMWFYQDGLIKNKLARSMSLQVMGNVESGAKVVLWTETRTPVQTWVAPLAGHISSVTFPGMVLDIKGGKSYDRHHVVIREESEELVDQQWELEFL